MAKLLSFLSKAGNNTCVLIHSACGRANRETDGFNATVVGWLEVCRPAVGQSSQGLLVEHKLVRLLFHVTAPSKNFLLRFSSISGHSVGYGCAGQPTNRAATVVAVGISSESGIGFGGCKFPQGFLVERQLENVLHNKSPFMPARCDENYRPVCEQEDEKVVSFKNGTE